MLALLSLFLALSTLVRLLSPESDRFWMLLTTCSRIPVPTRTDIGPSSRGSISAGAAMLSIWVRVPLVLVKVASPPLDVLITARPSSLRMPLNSEAATSLQTGCQSQPGPFPPSSLAMPIQLLRSVIMYRVLRFGVLGRLSEPLARLYNVSA